jgi:Uma2 family endonuclease
MNWQEVTENPNLQNLPFKIELNEWGQVVMNPVKLKHSYWQSRIARVMENMRQDGLAIPEFAIWTKKGTKVADVVWISTELWKKVQNDSESIVAPEICVEVISMSNSDAEMKEKRKLYFEQGASEVWLCDEYGDVTFYNSKGKLKQSKMFPEFPLKIII